MVLCATCVHGRNDRSGGDGDRLGATPVGLGLTVEDVINVDEYDSTDWRYVEIDKPGQITVELRWRHGSAELEFQDASTPLEVELSNALETVRVDGQVWGNNGRQLVANVDEPGRYYVRVEGPLRSDRLIYSLRVSFEKIAGTRCVPCVVGEQTCVGNTGFAICEVTKEGCNAWALPQACPVAQVCRNAQCGEGCVNQCSEGQRQCASDRASQICKLGPAGCWIWNEPVPCEGGMMCSGTEKKCRKSGGGGGTPPPPPPPYVFGTILTQYVEGTARMLHIQVPANSRISSETSATILDGTSDDPLADGALTVIWAREEDGKGTVKAQTKLVTVGNNRRVRFQLRR